MKIRLTSLGQEHIAIRCIGDSFTICSLKLIKRCSDFFGEECLNEILVGLAVLCDGSGEKVYERKEFSDPENNFKLEVICEKD